MMPVPLTNKKKQMRVKSLEVGRGTWGAGDPHANSWISEHSDKQHKYEYSAGKIALTDFSQSNR